MLLDENSSRELIINYIKYFSHHFLHYSSDKPWAQPYIDEAAKISAREESFYFLFNFSDATWAQPYIDEAAKNAARNSPFGFLSNLSGKPWAQPYIDDAVKSAAKKYPEYFLEKWADRFPHHINLALFALGSKNVSK